MKLVIDRTKWLRGEGSYDSKLIRSSDGKMCCMGFLGLAAGIQRDRLVNRADFQVCRTPFTPPWVYGPYRLASDDAFRLYTTNDDPTCDEKFREAKLAALFANHDIQVEFIN